MQCASSGNRTRNPSHTIACCRWHQRGPSRITLWRTLYFQRKLVVTLSVWRNPGISCHAH